MGQISSKECYNTWTSMVPALLTSKTILLTTHATICFMKTLKESGPRHKSTICRFCKHIKITE